MGMTDFGSALGAAFLLVVRPDPDLAEIVLPCPRVSVGAVFLATSIGMPLSQGTLFRFPGRTALA